MPKGSSLPRRTGAETGIAKDIQPRLFASVDELPCNVPEVLDLAEVARLRLPAWAVVVGHSAAYAPHDVFEQADGVIDRASFRI